MYSLEDIKNIIRKVSDDKLNTVISKDFLKLSDEQINTVSFVFWLSHMAEQDLEMVIKKAWENLKTQFTPDFLELTNLILNQIVYSTKRSAFDLEDLLKEVSSEISDKIRVIIKNNYNQKPKINIDNIPHFGDKIIAYEAIVFKNNVAIVLWKIKKLRDDVSHGRIDNLEYNDESLLLRSTKEKILIDYMGAVLHPDHSQSQLKERLKSLTKENPAAQKLLDEL